MSAAWPRVVGSRTRAHSAWEVPAVPMLNPTRFATMRRKMVTTPHRVVANRRALLSHTHACRHPAQGYEQPARLGSKRHYTANTPLPERVRLHSALYSQSHTFMQAFCIAVPNEHHPRKHTSSHKLWIGTRLIGSEVFTPHPAPLCECTNRGMPSWSTYTEWGMPHLHSTAPCPPPPLQPTSTHPSTHQGGGGTHVPWGLQATNGSVHRLLRHDDHGEEAAPREQGGVHVMPRGHKDEHYTGRQRLPPD
jgi:hypothetical protein